MRKKLIVFAAGIVMLVSVAFTTAGDRLFAIAKNLEIFSELFKAVNESYVDEVNPNELIKTSMNGMLDGLDPYTNYFGEDQVEDLRTMNTGQYGGIGAVTRRFGSRTVITEVYENFAAAKAGLRPGDEVLRIDGIEIGRLSVDEANQLVRGQVGNSLKLTIKKPSGTIIESELKREKVQLKTVPYSGMFDGRTGYLALKEFSMRSGDEVKQAVQSLHDKGAKALIIDLRGNPGGLLDEAVNICSLFLPKGSLVVTTKGKSEDNNKEYRTQSAPAEPMLPVAVVIDRSSASASEIVAGTLQDYDRAVVIGERSFGKGLVQVRRPLSYNSVAMITIAKYYTPSGRCIQVIDYSRRRADGSVSSVPDSLRKTFKTTRGRTVHDGGGIEPDLALPRQDEAGLTAMLDESGHLFDFVTGFVQKNTSIPPARDFIISDKLLDEFTVYVNNKKPVVKDQLQRAVDELQAAADESGYNTVTDQQLKGLRESLARFRAREIGIRGNEVRMLLAREIAARYHFEKGSVEAGFRYDETLKTTAAFLADTARYRKLLRP
ncbi:MAG: S41 family peptidase [Bacteroidota bacterium]